MMTGMMEKVRNANIYSYGKYAKYIELSDYIDTHNFVLTIAGRDNDFARFFKSVYFDNFCDTQMQVMNITFTE
jgi:hypothetical protein